MGRCQICSKQSDLVSGRLGVCLQCAREKPEEALKTTDKVHAESRERFGFPPKPPRNPEGILCGMCANNCKIGVGDIGFCGLVLNVDKQLVRKGGTPEKGIVQWYYDQLPTNCVAWWVCPGCTSAGYPKHAYKRGVETGYSNLAIFYGACSMDCLFCQNWHHRNLGAKLESVMTAESLAAKANPQVSCICFFGGDPSVQMPHALKTGEIGLRKAEQEKRILRVCWETNGYWKEEFALKAAELSLVSGGNIKFDLKTWDENLSRALCGVTNAPTLRSFKMIGKRFLEKRLDLPILTASTLLVPGYIDIEEIRNLASFIAEVDSKLPYTLLAFYPHYVMTDLPTTSEELAVRCRDIAEEYLENVRIGNIQLFG
ncbi:MAG: radical SAM protein [Candidatus Bathyarchaeota archaeon]|nr:MAG: radical SAM protein [Candidatus Bathyarchaeota archaeon]